MKSKVTKYRIQCAQQLKGLILDIGVGEGDYTQFLPNDVVSLDIDEENLKRVSGKKLIASATQLPFKDNTFDGVWSCAVLEHVEFNYIPEAIRVTKIGGTIFILTPNRKSPYDPIKRFFGLRDWWDHEGHVRLYTVKELKEFGDVSGEVWWAPGINQIARLLPALGHALMLRVNVTNKHKQKIVSV